MLLRRHLPPDAFPMNTIVKLIISEFVLFAFSELCIILLDISPSSSKSPSFVYRNRPHRLQVNIELVYYMIERDEVWK